MSKYNIELDSYGLKSNTEKAIVYLNLIVNTRFKVLQMLKKNKKLIEFASKYAKFVRNIFIITDGQAPNFEWIGHRKKDSINSDIATLKLNWAKTKRNNVSQFEKDSIKKDINIISEFIKKVINRFKR